MRWDYVLFDLDGTLNDSMPGIAKGIVTTLQRLGKPVPEWTELRWCIGPPMRQVMTQLLPGASETEVTQAIGLYREIYGAGGIFDATLFPGVRDLLAELHQGGHPFFLATSKPWPQARRILDHYQLSQFFTGIYGPEIDGTRGDKATLISYLIETEKLREQRGVMVGDREYDVIGARHNGLFALGVTYGYGSEVELRSAGADQICGSVSAVRDFLFRVDA